MRFRLDPFSLLAFAFLWSPLLFLGALILPSLWRDPTLLRHAWPSSELRRFLLGNTLQLGVGTVTLSLLLGLPVAITLARGPMWARLFAALGCSLPLALPPILPATLLVPLTFAPGADVTQIPPALIASPALAAWLYPLVAFGVSGALRTLPVESEEAARSLGNEWQTWRRVLFPLLKPAIYGVSGLCFAFAAWEMGAPDLLNLQTYAVQIHRDWNAGNLGESAVVPALDAFPLVLFGALGLWPAFRALRFYKRARVGASSGARSYAFGTVEKVALALTVVALILSPGVELWTLAGKARTAGAFARAGDLSRPELLTTLSIAPLAALFLVAWAFFVAARARLRGAGVSAWLVAPILFPPITLGLTLLGLWNAPLVNNFALQDAATWLGGSSGMTLVGYLARFLPLALWMTSEAASRVPDDWLEAAQGLGASPNRAMRSVLLPVLWPALSGVGAVLGALCVGELTVSFLVARAGGQPLTLPLFNFMHAGEEELVAAIGLWLFALGAGIMAAFALGGVLLSALWRKLCVR